MHALRSHVGRARREDGFTMLAAIGAMLAVMALSVTAFAAANGDIRFATVNHDQRKAYAAAEAGVADFLFRLSRDPDAWSRCETAPAPAKISKAWNGVGADVRKWRAIEDTGTSYAIEVLPADGYPACDPNVPLSIMDPDTGTFSIRATGRVGPADNPTGTKRSVIATFKRKNFLDYIYFTVLEDQDPVLWEKLMACANNTPNSEVTPACMPSRNPTISAWAASQCAKYWRDGRGNAEYPGEVYYSGSWHDYEVGCTEINFASGENIKGPLHSNDSLLVNGTPTFGRRKSDIIEVSASPSQQPWRPNGTSAPNFLGTWTPGAETLDPPPTNAELKKDATIVYQGATKIQLNTDGTMRVWNQSLAVSPTTVAQPTSGVIYVATSGACTLYDPYLPKVYKGTVATSTGCGDLSISGTYTKNLTFAADNDLVIVDDLRKSTNHDVVLGLIANNFVRVAHDSLLDNGGNRDWTGPECTTLASNATKDVKIDAAILALNHSFTVDRYGCGSDLGDLTVNGAIAQKFRGVVGYVGGTGFSKQYTYDDRLRFRTPPKFLDPVNTAWLVARQVEQVPAT